MLLNCLIKLYSFHCLPVCVTYQRVIYPQGKLVERLRTLQSGHIHRFLAHTTNRLCARIRCSIIRVGITPLVCLSRTDLDATGIQCKLIMMRFYTHTHNHLPTPSTVLTCRAAYKLSCSISFTVARPVLPQWSYRQPQ